MATYWTRRVNLSLNDNKNLNSTILSLNRVRLENAKQLRAVLTKLEAKYPDFKGISQNELRQLLNKTSLGQDIFDIQKTIADKQLTLIDDTIRENITNHYIFNHNDYLSKTLGEVLPTNTDVPTDVLSKILKSDITGKSYSERLYTDTEKVAQDVKTSLLSGVQQGLSIQDMATNLSNLAKISFNNAKRIVATEDTYYTNQSDLQDYEELGIKKYEYAAIMDSKTSDFCRPLNGKKFYLKDAEVGVNFPPLHVYCRSTTMPVFDDPTNEDNMADFNTYKNEINRLMKDFSYSDQVNFQKVAVGRSAYSFKNNTFSFSQSLDSDYLADSSAEGLARHEFAHFLSNKMSKEAGISVEQWSKDQLATYFGIKSGGKIDLSLISKYANDSSRWSEGFAELFAKAYKDGGSVKLIKWIGGNKSLEFVRKSAFRKLEFGD